MQLSVVILAAGKGKRMASEIPKVMHTLAGIPLLERVVKVTEALNPHQIHVVYGNGGSIIRDKFQYLNVNWVNQEQQLGTGHAVLQALPHCTPDDQILVLYGDVPLITLDTLQSLLQTTTSDKLGILVANIKDPTGLGRIIRNSKGQIIKIVEQRDANAEECQVNEINTGIITCSAKLLQKWLPNLASHNQQGEYYLTDIISMAVAEGIAINDVAAPCETEIQGVNDLWQLANLERAYQRIQAKKWALSGVKIIDPDRMDIRGDQVKLAQDVTLDVNVILEGTVYIGKDSKIGANCVIKDSTLGENVTVLPNSVIEGASIADFVQIGPFARLRTGTTLEENSKVGNFVEMKKTRLGRGSKANHLSYLGDALVGCNVNIGAGTITCNYDGENKWQTVIKDGAFIGSNTALVAPVMVGENATIGAGSTINQNAPDNQLTVARSRQLSLQGWKRPKKKNGHAEPEVDKNQ